MIEDDVRTLRDAGARLGLAPAPDPAPLALAGEEDWTEAMLARVTGAPAPQPTRPARRVRRRSVLLAAAASVAAAIAVGAALQGGAPAAAEPPLPEFAGLTDWGPETGTDGRAALAALAAGIDAEPAPGSPGAGVQRIVTDQWRLEVRFEGEDVTTTVRPTHEETWLLADGRALSRERQTGASFDGDGRLIAGVPTGAAAIETVPARRDPAEVRALPREPAALAARWLDGATAGVTDPSPPAATLTSRIVDAFTWWVVPPETAATMWAALAAQEGVRDLGTGTDRAGRAGHAFGVWEPVTKEFEVLVVDPRTGALLSVDTVMFGWAAETAAPFGSPRVMAYVLFRSADWVARPM